jgi:hypothetical protein
VAVLKVSDCHKLIAELTVPPENIGQASDFSGRFAKLRKATVTVVMSVCLSIRPYGATRLPLGGFLRNLSTYRKSIEKSEVWLKSDKNNGYFTWRPVYISDNMSLNCSSNEKYFRQKL